MARRGAAAAMIASPKKQACAVNPEQLGEALLMVQQAGKLAGRVVNGCVRVDHFGRNLVLECSNGYNSCARAILETTDEGIPFTAVVPIHEFYVARSGAVSMDKGVLYAGGTKVPTLALATPAMPIPPGLDPSGSASVDASALLAAMEYAGLARSRDDARPHMTALRFKVLVDTLQVVGIDGHRLAFADVSLVPGAKELTSFTMPASAIESALAVLRAQPAAATATIARRMRRVCITGGNNWQIEFDDQDGTDECAFPDSAHVVLSSGVCDATITIDERELHTFRKIVTAASKGRQPQIIDLSLTQPDSATPGTTAPATAHVERVDPSGERNVRGITVESTDIGSVSGRSTVRAGVQGRYLRDALHGIRGVGVEIRLFGEHDQIQVRAPGRFSVVMPIRL